MGRQHPLASRLSAQLKYQLPTSYLILLRLSTGGTSASFRIGAYAPIRPVTGRRSLLATSFARCPFPPLAGSVPLREGNGVAVFSKWDTASGLGAVFRPGVSVRPFGCSYNQPNLTPYRFGPCVLPLGSDSFSHVSELRPLRRFTLRSPYPTHPGGSAHRTLRLPASSQGLHTPRLLGTHALVGSMGDESHGYFARFLAFHNPPCCFSRRT